jgi:hypothetical protein
MITLGRIQARVRSRSSQPVSDPPPTAAVWMQVRRLGVGRVYRHEATQAHGVATSPFRQPRHGTNSIDGAEARRADRPLDPGRLVSRCTAMWGHWRHRDVAGRRWHRNRVRALWAPGLPSWARECTPRRDATGSARGQIRRRRRPGVTAAVTTAALATGAGPGVTARVTTAAFATGAPTTPTRPTRDRRSGMSHSR